VIQYGWFVDLLPHLDQEPLVRGIAAGSNGNPTDPKTGKLIYPKIAVATCPQDTNNFQQNHGLSYVANAGYMTAKEFGAQNTNHDGLSIDYTGDGVFDKFDVIAARATGVFWRSRQDVDPAGDEIRPMTLDYIALSDGQTQTVMLSESIQARFYTSPMTGDIAFGIVNPIATPTTATKKPSMSLPASFQLRRPNNNSSGPWDAINSDFKRRPGTTSRPSSNHPGQFNIAYCDGRVVAISEKIEEAVYARMLTPDGQRFGQMVDLD
jgi:prepilin-type processing-associated H-X9-DG protein